MASMCAVLLQVANYGVLGTKEIDADKRWFSLL
jgi:hypothetical protein